MCTVEITETLHSGDVAIHIVAVQAASEQHAVFKASELLSVPSLHHIAARLMHQVKPCKAQPSTQATVRMHGMCYLDAA